MTSARNDSSEARAKSVRRSIAAVLATFVLMTSPAALAATNVDARGQVSPVTDALLLRPMGIAATLGGAGLFLVSTPIVAITRPTELGVTFEWLILKPFRYTWLDPLGDHATPIE